MSVTATDGATRATVRAEPNVAPMIDVMLVLLVIFMIVVPAMAAGTPAVPPRGTNLSPRPEIEEDQTLGIDRAGRFYLNRRPIAAAELRDRLHAIFAAPGREGHVLYVTADRDLDYGVVRDAVASASAAGVRVVGLVAEATPSSSSLPRR